MAFEDIQRVDRLGEKDKSALIAARAYIYFKRKNRLAGDVAFVIQRWLTGHFFRLPIVLDVGKYLLDL